MTHPFAEFNKCENQGTLVGNWVEEHALKDLTGSFRYKAWVDHKDVEGDSVYPKHLTASRMETFGRVFEHSDNLVSWTSWGGFLPLLFPFARAEF